MKNLLFFIFLVLLIPAYALADDFDDALKAYNQGNYSKAAELFQKVCDGGDALGCNNLGVMYAKGKGVKQDYFKAVELFQKACDSGIAEGCYNLGLRYTNGQGVKQDFVKAKYFFGKACDMELQQGCDNYRKLNEMGY